MFANPVFITPGRYTFNEYRNWSEINQSNYTIHGRKLAWFSYAVITGRKPSADFQRVFRHCRK